MINSICQSLMGRRPLSLGRGLAGRVATTTDHACVALLPDYNPMVGMIRPLANVTEVTWLLDDVVAPTATNQRVQLFGANNILHRLFSRIHKSIAGCIAL